MSSIVTVFAGVVDKGAPRRSRKFHPMIANARHGTTISPISFVVHFRDVDMMLHIISTTRPDMSTHVGAQGRDKLARGVESILVIENEASLETDC
jgi:hypothetical protein